MSLRTNAFAPTSLSFVHAGGGAIARWTVRILNGLAVAFLLFDTALKLLELPPAIEATTQLGFARSAVLQLGAIEALCLVLYLVPRTAPVGALLLTGYLGGAIATHLRLDNPLFSHTLFPIYVASLLWLPLWLRDARVRGLFARREFVAVAEDMDS
jgi:hypothetical protein